MKHLSQQVGNSQFQSVLGSPSPQYRFQQCPFHWSTQGAQPICEQWRALLIDMFTDASKSWTAAHQVQQASKHVYHCIYDSLSNNAVLWLAKYQTDFHGNVPLLFMYITTKLSKPTLAIIEE